MIEPMKPKLVMLDETYRLELGDQKSEEVDYGEPVEFAGFIAFVDLDDDGNPCTPLDHLVYAAQGVECEEVSE